MEVERPTFLTGSRAIGGARLDSDWDFVVLSEDAAANERLKAKGFVTETMTNIDYPPGSEFMSWKKDSINYIVVFSKSQYDKWLAATNEAKSDRALTRAARIAIFKKHLYPEKSDD